MGSAYEDAATFAGELDIARTTLQSPPGTALAIGVGFLGWTLDAGGNPVKSLTLALEAKVKAIWFSFGTDLGKWVEHVRQYDRKRDTPHKTLIWIVVNSLAEAETATKEWKADVLIVQGIEAGGHGHGQALPLLALVPLIQGSLPNAPPLLAAGGLTHGAHVAAMLVLGASAAVMGTRFLLTPESTYTSQQKDTLRAATDTVRTLAYDEVRGTSGWPEGVDGRAVPNKVLEDKESGLSLEERQKRFQEAAKNGDSSRNVVWAGTSVGLVNEIRDAGDVVRSVHREIVEHLSQASGFL